MAKISKLKAGYAARFWYNDLQGEQQSKYKSGFKTKREAEAWAEEEKTKAEFKIKAISDKVSDLSDEFIREKELQGIAYHTLRKYKLFMNKIKAHFGQTPIDKITKPHIIEFLETQRLRKNNTIAKSSMQICKKMLVMLFKFAQEASVTDRNPAELVKLPREKIEYQTLTVEQARLLLAELKEKNSYLYPIVLIALTFGLRRGEICALRNENIEKDLIVAGSAYFDRNKHETIIKLPKTSSGKRILPISDAVRAEILSYKANNAISSDFVVCSPDGSQCNPDTVTFRFREYMRGFSKRTNAPYIRFHDLRHTFAVLSLSQKTDLDTLKRMLGHSSIEITSNIYLHDNKDLMNEQLKKVTTILLQ